MVIVLVVVSVFRHGQVRLGYFHLVEVFEFGVGDSQQTWITSVNVLNKH